MTVVKTKDISCQKVETKDVSYFDFTVWPDHFIIFFEFFVAQNVAFGDFLKNWQQLL